MLMNIRGDKKQMNGAEKYLLKDEIKSFIDHEKEKYAKKIFKDFKHQFGHWGKLRFVLEIDLILEYNDEKLYDILK